MILNSEIHIMFLLPRGLQEKIDEAFKAVSTSSPRRRFRLNSDQRARLFQGICEVARERLGEGLSISDICRLLGDRSGEFASWGRQRLHRFVMQRLKSHPKSGFEEMNKRRGKRASSLSYSTQLLPITSEGNAHV